MDAYHSVSYRKAKLEVKTVAVTDPGFTVAGTVSLLSDTEVLSTYFLPVESWPHSVHLRYALVAFWRSSVNTITVMVKVQTQHVLDYPGTNKTIDYNHSRDEVHSSYSLWSRCNPLCGTSTPPFGNPLRIVHNTVAPLRHEEMA
ncbi:hypothetical protein DL546_001755 [Coniochaeta pulveracea]|uniref:Uncharacterized protein n=1 Tax=Coniochaeta pulveracea TaxID=177199 RepID=A0A420YFK8_9PEZI|nr:hypothetical protein DL546_001755 [Coniochaeta pulveracea]